MTSCMVCGHNGRVKRGSSLHGNGCGFCLLNIHAILFIVKMPRSCGECVWRLKTCPDCLIASSPVWTCTNLRGECLAPEYLLSAWRLCVPVPVLYTHQRNQGETYAFQNDRTTNHQSIINQGENVLRSRLSSEPKDSADEAANFSAESLPPDVLDTLRTLTCDSRIRV